MKGFKDSTKVQYAQGGDVGVKGAAKISKVMGEFKRGELHSGSKKGPEVTSKKQALAIALSEAGKSKPVKKARGGMMQENITSRPVKIGMTDEEKAMAAALARAERIQAEEARESRMAPRRTPPRDPRVPLIKRATGGLAAMPRKKGC